MQRPPMQRAGMSLRKFQQAMAMGARLEVLVDQGQHLVRDLVGAEALGLQILQALEHSKPVQGRLL